MKSPTCFMLTIISLLLITGCMSDGGDSTDTYYEFAFVDKVSTPLEGDTVHIILIQRPIHAGDIEVIPYELTEDANLGDTVKLSLRVFYGGYSPIPSPRKRIEVDGDSLRLYYDRAAVLPGLKKGDARTSTQNSPKITYYTIRGVGIAMAPGRRVTVKPLNIR